MRVLLDTNIIIHRENVRATNISIGKLYYWLDKLHYDKLIHPLTIKELKKYNNSDMQELYDAKLPSYIHMKTIAKQTPDFISLIQDVNKTVNDAVDNQLLFEIFCNRADILITEDRAIFTKAEKLGLSERVFSINGFISKCVSENPELLDYKALSVKKITIGEINIDDPFFDTLKKSYHTFSNWFSKKCDNDAYICCDDKGNIMGFLFLKLEGTDEPYNDIKPVFAPKKRLKIGTFKVESTGFRLGERFIKIVFDNAIINDVDEIYVTMFKNLPETKALCELLVRWGFFEYGIKTTEDGIETVYVKKLKSIMFNSIKKDYPNLLYKGSKFILPIRAEFHTKLLPDSIMKNENEDDFIGNDPYKYALQKVYITWGDTKYAKQGDYILFYRMGPEGTYKRFSSTVTSLGIVDEIVKGFSSKQDFMNHCQNRSIFTKEELNRFWDNHRNNLKIIKFIYIATLNNKITLDTLRNLGVVGNVEGPRPFHIISDKEFDDIMSFSKTDIKYLDRG